jgi:hypothetical protein
MGVTVVTVVTVIMAAAAPTRVEALVLPVADQGSHRMTSVAVSRGHQLHNVKIHVRSMIYGCRSRALDQPALEISNWCGKSY